MSLRLSIEYMEPDEPRMFVMSPNPVITRALELDFLPISPPLVRSRKYICSQCYSIFSWHEPHSLCLNCVLNGCRISKWWKKIQKNKALIQNILVMNIVSRKMMISEIGIGDNIIKFL